MIQHETIKKLALLLTERKFEAVGYRLGLCGDRPKSLKETAFVLNVTPQAIRNLESFACLIIARGQPNMCEEIYNAYKKYHRHVPRYIKRALKNKKGE